MTVPDTMPSVTLISTVGAGIIPTASPLPSLLQTPAGLAIIEIQGTIHAPLPQLQTDGEDTDTPPQMVTQTPVGRLEFPLFDAASDDKSEGPWMKKVHLYIGQNQRLNGEIKKLSKPLAVIANQTKSEAGLDIPVELQIVEVVRYKILFSSRPEPVGS